MDQCVDPYANHIVKYILYITVRQGKDLRLALIHRPTIRLEQSSPRVILEQLSVADVSPQGIHRLVPGDVHHLED